MAGTFFSEARSPLSHLDCKLIGALVIHSRWIVLLSVFKPIYISSALQSCCHLVSHLHVQTTESISEHVQLRAELPLRHVVNLM